MKETPAGDSKGLSKEILEQRRKIAEQSKRDKAEEKARLAKSWKEQKKKLDEMSPGDEHGLSDEVLAQRRKVEEDRKASKQREAEALRRRNEKLGYA